MSDGWRFTVLVPSWTTHVVSDEKVVLYRVEVRVQSGSSVENQRTRSVLRRFSDFLRLHATLKARMPARMKGKDAPSKRTLMLINHSAELVEKRRKSLEEWLWLLLSDIHISGSRELAQFLELSSVMNRIDSSGVDNQEQSSTEPGTSGGELEGTDDALEGGSLGSDTTSTIEQSQATSSHSKGSPSLASVGQMTRSVGGGAAARMGLRIENRPTVRKVMADLQERLEKAKQDLEDAIDTAECERHAREAMADQLAEVIHQLKGSAGDPPARQISPGGEDAHDVADLRASLDEERQTVLMLRQQLDETRRERAAQQSVSRIPEEAPTSLQQQVEALRKQMQEKETCLKSDMKVLAKEVKKLRKEKAAAESRAAAAEEQAAAARARATGGVVADGNGHVQQGDALVTSSCSQFVELVDSLRTRMAACDLETMACEAQTEEATSDDLVATSNNRIAALLAEAQLLRTGQSANLGDLPRAAADVVQDVGLLRQQLNNSTHLLSLGHGSTANGSHDSKFSSFMHRLKPNSSN